METKIPIYLPDKEAKQFLKFQEHYDVFMILLESGIFEQKKGAVTLHFDESGTLQTIQRQDFLYSRRFDKK